MYRNVLYIPEAAWVNLAISSSGMHHYHVDSRDSWEAILNVYIAWMMSQLNRERGQATKRMSVEQGKRLAVESIEQREARLRDRIW